MGFSYRTLLAVAATLTLTLVAGVIIAALLIAAASAWGLSRRLAEYP